MAFEVNPVAVGSSSVFDAVLFDAAAESASVLQFQLQKTNAAGRFEWSDGFLVDALQVCEHFHYCDIHSESVQHSRVHHFNCAKHSVF